jgi:hypothetical protein
MSRDRYMGRWSFGSWFAGVANAEQNGYVLLIAESVSAWRLAHSYDRPIRKV